MKRIICLSLFMLMAMFVSIAFATEPGEYYTQANIRYERPERISSVNYHVGVIIPYASKVQVIQTARGRIMFTDENGMTFTVIHYPKYSNITFQAFFDRYFSKKKPNIKKFNAKEKKAIETGDIQVGMSKDAVIAAYGYPPSHKTPNLEMSPWTYWINRYRTQAVYFNKKDKVSAIQ